MLPFTLVIMLVVSGGAAINTTLAFSSKQACEKEAATISASGAKLSGVYTLAVCVEAGK